MNNRAEPISVAAYQAPLFEHRPCRHLDGIAVRCCPEAILGGLPTSLRCPHAVPWRQPASARASCQQDVTTIFAFSEVSSHGTLYNPCGQNGRIASVYRKNLPQGRRPGLDAGTRDKEPRVYP